VSMRRIFKITFRKSPKVLLLWVIMKNVTYTRFEWEGNFNFRIED